MESILQSLISGIVVGSIYALIALGFVLIYKSTAVINFAQGELLMFGAYLCLTLVVALKIPFWLAFFATLIAAALLGFVLERLFLRPMIGEPAISIIMLTIGLASFLKGILHVIWGSETRVYSSIFPTEPLKFGTIVISQVYLYSVFFAVLCLVLFNFYFRFSRSGIAMRAVANDQQAAQSMGISIKKIFAIAWAIAAVVASVGGILIGNINGVNASLSSFGLKVFPAVILGGLDSIPGGILGGFIIGLLEALSGIYLDPIFEGGSKEVMPFVVLVVVLMIKPYGLFGTEEIEKI
ncbi:MAG: branched-chain amino acid ABC transporter permease [Proteobacteria bacterium]|nr:branched-chain amino acid ABC transporter permease [Pseudomonadota bacterium]